MLISSPWIPFLILPSQMSPKHTPHAATALGTCFLSNFPHIACACFFCWFFKPFHFLTQASECRCLLLYIIFVPFILFCHHAFYSFHHSFGFHVIAADEALVHTYRCFAKHFPSEVYPCGHVKWSVVYQLHQCTVNPLLALLGLFTSLELKLRLRNKLIPHPQNVVLWCLSYVDVDLIIFAFWYVQNCIW